MKRQQTGSSIDERVAEKLDAYRRQHTQRYQVSPNIPPKLFRGVLRGILIYFTQPARRRKAERFHLDILEECLLAYVETNIGPRPIRERTYSNEEVGRFANDTLSIIATLFKHPSPIILRHESRWILQELTNYSGDSLRPRLKWLKQRSRRILVGLNRITRCPSLDCERETSLPSDDLLAKWASQHRICCSVSSILGPLPRIVI